jgi:hypothetical protein
VTLSAGVSTYGPGRGNVMLVVFQVTDGGTAATGALTATITLPSGSAMTSGGFGHHGSQWTCQPTPSGATCQHDPISAGQQTFGMILVQLTGTAACGQSVQLTATSGAASASAQSPQPIQCSSGGHALGTADGPALAFMAASTGVTGRSLDSPAAATIS